MTVGGRGRDTRTGSSVRLARNSIEVG